MPNLNNALLTTDGMLAEFEKRVLKGIKGKAPRHSNAPSLLDNFKKTLKTVYFNQSLGCKLVLTHLSPDQAIDLKSLSRKPPALVKQGEKYYIFGPHGSKGNAWKLTLLDSALLSEQALPFPDLDKKEEQAEQLLSYDPNHQALYSHLRAKNNQILLNERPSDAQIAVLITQDSRFEAGYPYLKYVLQSIFELPDEKVPKQLEVTH